jgi:hypothetical protein
VRAAGDTAAAVVSRAIHVARPDDRVRLARELMAHAAAALVVLEGSSAAAESCYRLADAVVAREA